MAHDIFISYRRSDAQHAAFALQAQLTHVFGSECVFLDREWIDAGDNWRDCLERALAGTRVVLALIGPKWLRAADEWGRRRLDDPDDWVRIELATALERGIQVIPLMLEGAGKPPPAQVLDSSLAQLFATQAKFLHDDSWKENLNGLVDQLIKKHAFNRVDRNSVYAAGRVLGQPVATLKLPALKDDEVVRRLRETGLAGNWRIEHHPHPWVVAGTAQELARMYDFENFFEAVDFMAAAARQVAAWSPPHHPRWQNQWQSVQVWFSTWDVGCRVTDLDLEAAAALDAVYRDFLRGRLGVQAEKTTIG